MRTKAWGQGTDLGSVPVHVADVQLRVPSLPWTGWLWIDLEKLMRARSMQVAWVAAEAAAAAHAPATAATASAVSTVAIGFGGFMAPSSPRRQGVPRRPRSTSAQPSASRLGSRREDAPDERPEPV